MAPYYVLCNVGLLNYCCREGIFPCSQVTIMAEDSIPYYNNDCSSSLMNEDLFSLISH